MGIPLGSNPSPSVAFATIRKVPLTRFWTKDKMAKKTLDAKLAAIRAGKYRPTDFIIADAKDGDIGFGAEANANDMRHFLEVFNPAFDIRLQDAADMGAFINDNIVRTLAGVIEADHPLFLKLQYNGPRAMEELSAYDPGHLIVGILG